MPYPWPQMIKAGFLLLFVSLIHTIMILLGFSALSYALVMRYRISPILSGLLSPVSRLWYFI